MNYFSKIVMIKYVCGHKKLGIDTYQPFVTKNSVKCPKCSEEGEKKGRERTILFQRIPNTIFVSS
ncbi:MAG: hypothetical protein FIB07_07855 [Candidatus Methanoperedens sp.]|nr:hypothetical protein [Candidatus Methanoperedens sp.]